MKEVTIKRFEKGDLIRGKNSGYLITNGDMARGEVTHVDGERMKVKILEHVRKREIGEEYSVLNSTECFELLPKVNNKASEDAKLEIRVIAEKGSELEITVVAEKGSELVSALVNHKGRLYRAIATCSPDDEFDLRKGATLAISRALDLMDKKVEEPKEPDGPVKIGDLVRVRGYSDGGLKDGDLTEVIGIGRPTDDKPFVYVAAKTESGYDGNCCRVPGRDALKRPFTYLTNRDYEILPEQPVRPKK